MEKSILLCCAIAVVVALNGCQDAYVPPTYTLADLIDQVEQHHLDIVARSEVEAVQDPGDTGMLHHSLHEIDATLGAIIELSQQGTDLEADHVVALKGIANELRKAYRKLDDEFHSNYKIDMGERRESIQNSLDRLFQFR